MLNFCKSGKIQSIGRKEMRSGLIPPEKIYQRTQTQTTERGGGRGRSVPHEWKRRRDILKMNASPCLQTGYLMRIGGGHFVGTMQFSGISPFFAKVRHSCKTPS